MVNLSEQVSGSERLHLATNPDWIMTRKCNLGLVVDFDGLRNANGGNSSQQNPFHKR